MKKFLLGLGFSLLAGLGHSQVQSGAFRLMLRKLLQHSVPEMSVVTAARENTGWTFLDAREAEEYAVSHLPGARYVGYETFDLSTLNGIPPNQPLVVYCSVGYRSEKIAEKLRAAGFTNVHNLYGGIFEWVNQGHPVYNNQGSTSEVHAFSRAWGVWLRKGKRVY